MAWRVTVGDLRVDVAHRAWIVPAAVSLAVLEGAGVGRWRQKWVSVEVWRELRADGEDLFGDPDGLRGPPGFRGRVEIDSVCSGSGDW